VVGLTQGAATKAITGAGLTPGRVTRQNTTTVARGSVISQHPASGSSVADGSPVNLVISSGPQMVTVPNAVGLTQEAATKVITGAGLSVGAVTTQNSSAIASGSVISQQPGGGSSVPMVVW
jgi:beta-lactam-binding protein with PASTA domain